MKKLFKLLAIFLCVGLAVGLLAYASDGFSNWKFKTWFHGWTKFSTSAAADHGLSKSAANENNIYLDSEDVPTTVAVNYAAAPFVGVDSNGLYIYYQYESNVGPKCEVRIGLKSKYETQYETLTFQNEIIYPAIQNHKSNRTNKKYIAFSQIKTIADKFGWNGTEDLVVATKGLGFSTTAPAINCIDSSLSVTTFKFISEPAVMSLSGSRLTIKIPNGVDCSSYSVLPMNITFSDGGDFSQTFRDGTSGCTLSGNTYTIDLTKLTCINTPTEHITVSATYGGGTTSMRYVFPMNTLSFAINKLANPSNIQYSNGVLSWDAVEGAQGYKLFFDDDSSEFLVKPQYDFNGKAEGTYNLRIRAVGNVGTSLSRNATPFNVSSNIVQLVTLTYDINGDTVTKFVPHGKELSDYLYAVELDGYNFGGWYYDTGYSVAANSFDKINADTTIYARLAEGDVESPSRSWWSVNKWKVLAPIIAVAGAAVIVLAVCAIRKKGASRA